MDWTKVSIVTNNPQCLKITVKVSFNIASVATFTFWVDKSQLKMAKMASFWKVEACGQIVLPDMLVGQKLMENAKIQKFKCDIFSNFQTLWFNKHHQG